MSVDFKVCRNLKENYLNSQSLKNIAQEFNIYKLGFKFQQDFKNNFFDRNIIPPSL